MAEPTGNLLIGKGEQLFENGEWSGSSRKKPPPYTIEHQRSLLGRRWTNWPRLRCTKIRNWPRVEKLPPNSPSIQSFWPRPTSLGRC